MRLAGILPGFVILIFTAICSHLSGMMLVSCSNHSNSNSYENIVGEILGKKTKRLSMLLVLSITFLSLVAFIIQLRDLISPIISDYLIGHELSSYGQNVVAFVSLLVITPACLVEELNGLENISIVSILAAFSLVPVLIFRWSQCIGTDISKLSLNLWPSSGMLGILQSIPLFVSSYIFHFNLLPVHNELVRPTGDRMKKTLKLSIAIVCIFNCTIAIFGNLCESCSGINDDDILNTFGRDDVVANIGRVAMSINLMLSFPFLIIPCRETLARIDFKEIYALFVQEEPESAHVNGDLLQSYHGISSDIEENKSEDKSMNVSIRKRISITLGIILTSMITSSCISHVSEVWDLVGSSACCIFAFTIPTCAFLKVCSLNPEIKSLGNKKILARVMLWSSLVLAFACTAINMCNF